jgi:hypothetical protein
MIDIDPGPSITAATAMKSATRVLFISTPTDRNLAASEGGSIWALRASDVEDQIDELVREGRVADAIGLVEAVGEAGLSPVSVLYMPQRSQAKSKSESSPTSLTNPARSTTIRLLPVPDSHGHVLDPQCQPSSNTSPVPR